MLRTIRIAILTTSVLAGPSWAQETANCSEIRLAETGWSDLALTTATARQVLGALGYETTSQMLGLGVIYKSLEKGDVDAFLGYWPKAQVEFSSFYDSGAVEVLSTNLDETKFTLAVPSYVAEAGVQSFDDLATHADRFGAEIYGIEPGSNRYLIEMVEDGRYGLGEWKVVESSEQGMLAQVQNAVAKEDWIVFLGWEPHPMNRNLDMTYLSGGDDVLGANYGADTIHTVARENFKVSCANAARLLSNLHFTIDYENAGMSLILDDGQDSDDAALDMMRQNPELVYGWLDGVTTREGEPALPAVEAMLTEGQ